MQNDSSFISDFRALLVKHGISVPRSAHSSKSFDPSKPSVLYSGPVHDAEEIVAAVEAVVESKWQVAGEKVARFEREFAAAVGNKHGVMVNSGSSANLALMGAAKERFGWEDGSEVITACVGFPTTVSPIVQNNLKPLFVDIEFDSLNIDVSAIESVITPRTRAIFIAPVLGNPPDMDRIRAICRAHGLVLLIDDCDSLKTRWDGVELPSLEGVSGATCSLYPSHHISCAGGGIVTSNDGELIRIARSMASWAKDCYCSSVGNLLPNGCCNKRFSCWLPAEPDLIVDHRYVFPRMGWNLLPTEIQGAMAVAQMKKLDGIVAKRKGNHKLISAWLARVPGIRGVKVEQKSDVSWFGVPIIAETQVLKESFLRHLEKNGIQTRGYFAGNLLAQEGFKHLGDFRLYPNSNQVLRRVFFIGCAPTYTPEHLAHIERVIASFSPPTSP